jgi:peptidoglycan/LPS O-acetylase OafA/YrhL
MGSRPTINYQPALDGVRAVAVLAVLAFHAEVPGFSGGYLGVSVFFTLSGFLITSLLVNEAEITGRVSAGAFYARRARRLLPASVLCVALIVVLAAVTDLFDGVADLRAHVVGSLLQVANWVFLFGDGSYQQLFQQAAGTASPLEHYWSLAIEEQFYWLWPISFLALTRVAKTRRAQIALLGTITAAFAVSSPVIAALWGGDAAYWATPARAAEILIGGVLALAVTGRSLPARWSMAAPAALLALAAAVALFPSSGGPAYSGALPLVALGSAALLLGLQVDGPVRTALSIVPLVWLGRISYGVYLYHWPVYVIVDERRTDLDGAPLVLLRLAITLAIAQVSYMLVELPIRRGRSARLPITFAAAAGVTAAVAIVGFAVVPASAADYWSGSEADAKAASIEPTAEPLAPVVARPESTTRTTSTTTPPATPVSAPVDTAADTAPATALGDTVVADTVSDGTVPATTALAPIPELTRPVRIIVAGDSTAMATGAGMVAWAAANPDLAQVEIVAEPGCGFVRGGEVMVLEWTPVGDRCDEWLDQTLPSRVEALGPDVVMMMTTSWDVLDRRWPETGEVLPTDPAYRERIVRDLADVSDRLAAGGSQKVVWVREPIPNVYWWGSGQAQEDPVRHAEIYAAMDAAAESSDGRVVVVELPGWLREQGLDVDQDARPDGVHWSPEASLRIADEYLAEQLIRVALAPVDESTGGA